GSISGYVDRDVQKLVITTLTRWTRECTKKCKGEKMNEEMTQQLMTTAEKLANAAEALDRVRGKLDAQQEALNAKVDRIVAAVEERLDDGDADDSSESSQKLQARAAEGEEANTELKPRSAGMPRKT